MTTADHYLSPTDQPTMLATETGTRVVSLDASGDYRLHITSSAYVERLVTVLGDLRCWLIEDERRAS